MRNPQTGTARELRRWVFQDWEVNDGYRDSQLILAWFRLAQWSHRRWGATGRRLNVVYRLVTSLVCSVELPAELEVGPRLRVFHPHSIVLNPGVRLGADCVLRQNVTIGNVVRRDGSEKGVASAGDGVEFGAGAVVVGALHVGDRARVGALALVLADVPAGGVVVGNPARLVRVDEDHARGTGPSTTPASRQADS
ncbi:putative colanic acid biosynthesis acetyltransferase WcaB [Friedmanniella luteola]|uniref:Putative colanic acid biosynthesis acetyltransferase WcaB n=1 Tax=Friedmanniella luteola TaxID=546871 RepID=A0A1H1YDA6_9ACTN|nr:serine acetyltransferase [Friedmanniella luteola]SDT19433.1 putative colanic acid biosynthesis acetyltransferase WcaB [Friedmanniella luteola]